MNFFVQQYVNTRAKLGVFALLAMVLVGLWFWEAQQGSSTEQVAAKVVALGAGEANSGALPLVWCELPDGTRVRLYAGGEALRVGDAVVLAQTTGRDGARSYQLQATAP